MYVLVNMIITLTVKALQSSVTICDRSGSGQANTICGVSLPRFLSFQLTMLTLEQCVQSLPTR